MKSNRTSALRVLGTVVISGALWAAACGSRTPLNLVPSGEPDDGDGTGQDDAAVRSDAGADRSLDSPTDGEADARDADRADGADMGDRLDVADRLDLADRFDIADIRDTPPDLPCFAVSREGKGIPIDFLFLVDKSTSMAGDAGMQSRWSAMANALNTFIQSPSSAEHGAGVTFFPRATASGTSARCAVSDYATPDVPIGALPGVAPAIAMALAAQRLSSGTPTTPALQAALEYARREKLARPTRDVAVVLVSDGVPSQCNSSLDTSTAVIRTYANGSPPVRTYVLGIGPSVNNLNAFALAGGTAPAHLIESGGEAELLAAFSAIRDNAITCEYDVPTMPGVTLDYTLVSLQARVGITGTLTPLTRIANDGACAQTGGWYYDQPVPPGNPPPKKITLCPATCSALMTTPGSHLDAIIGCKSTTP